MAGGFQRFKTEIGATLKAQLRQGAKEAAQALPAFKDSVQIVEEPGLPGNLTPQEVVQQKQPDKEPNAPEPEMEP